MNVVLATLALAVSIATATQTWRWRTDERRTAQVGVVFHRNTELARVVLRDGSQIEVGYSLVVLNRGPSAARDVTISVFAYDGTPLELVDLVDGEVPICHLAAGTHYPIPWIVKPAEPARRRLAFVELDWVDGRGAQHSRVQIRRSET